MGDGGYIKIYRKILDNPIVCKDADYFSVWMYLLLNATHKGYDVIFKNERIKLQPGQLITGRKKIAEFLKVEENKVQRILKKLEDEHQIEQQTGNQNRLISIVNWNEYQSNEQPNEQQMNNERTTNEQRMNTNNNVNNVKKEINNIKMIKFIPPNIDEINKYILEKGLNVDGYKFYNYFTEGKWIDSKGNKVKNWKQKLLTWDKYMPKVKKQNIESLESNKEVLNDLYEN